MPEPLSMRDREVIYACVVEDRDMTWTEIGRRIGRCRTTVSREVARGGGRSHYRPSTAHTRAVEQRRRPKPCKLEVDVGLRDLVIADLQAGYSPAAITHRLTAGSVATETIYRAVYTGLLGLEPSECLRTRRPRRKPRRRQSSKRGQYLGGYTPISDRPAHIEDRTQPGHWEGDLIIGRYNQSAMITLIERLTRFTVLLALTHGYGTRPVITALTQWLPTVPEPMRRSLTWDQGAEMTRWPDLIGLIPVVYFCEPHSPWQKGAVEQNNRTLRFWLPRNANLATIDPTPVMSIINSQPRRSLGWATPAQIYQNLHNVR